MLDDDVRVPSPDAVRSVRPFGAGIRSAARRRTIVAAASLTAATLVLALVERAWPSDGEWLAPVQWLLRSTALAALVLTGIAFARAASRPGVGRAARLAEAGLATTIAVSFVLVATFAWPPLDHYDTSSSYAAPPLPWLAPTEADEREAERTRWIRSVKAETAALDPRATRPVTVAAVVDAVASAGALPMLRWARKAGDVAVVEAGAGFYDQTLAIAVLADPPSAAAYASASTLSPTCGKPVLRANLTVHRLRCATDAQRRLSDEIMDELERRLGSRNG